VPRWCSIILWASVVLGAFALAQPARAAEAFFAGPAAHRTGHVFSVSFHVEGAFMPKMEEALLSGVTQSFTFHFEVFRVISAWPDLRIYNWTVRRTISYDTLKKTFTVDDGGQGPKKQTKQLEQAKKWMIDFERFPVAVVPALEGKSKHFVRLKAELDPVEWPLYLNRILFFANLWDFETPWLRIDLPLDQPDESSPTPSQ
jgi:uncharacterized protein DUF4390